jgi:hypothetical protein
MITLRFNTDFQLSFSSTEEWDDFYAEEEEGKLVWTNSVLDDIMHQLETMSGAEGGQWDVSTYADEADGTINLWLDLLEDGRSIKYAIGVVIFHQMLYESPLTATKLTG